ncbi:hypothetical protein Tco_0458172 [Tanacetum coccineum]
MKIVFGEAHNLRQGTMAGESWIKRLMIFSLITYELELRIPTIRTGIRNLFMICPKPSSASIPTDCRIKVAPFEILHFSCVKLSMSEALSREYTTDNYAVLDENNTPIPADKALKNKDIHPIFPLFDQNLLSHEEQKQILPINPQVNKVFVESDQVALSSTSAYDRIESRLKDKVGCSNSDGRDAFVFLKKPVRSAVEGSSLKGNGGKRKGLKAENGMFLGHEVCLRSMGPLCMWRKQPTKLSKKSNSTCFSKLWRLKDKVGCSNSDGRNAFVFLKKPIRC